MGGHSITIYDDKKIAASNVDGCHREYEDVPTRERDLVTSPESTSEMELRELVRQAQQYNQDAIDELYERFKTMIQIEVKRLYFRETLGEDAENIAWEIFYTTIHEFDVDKTKRIASLLKVIVHKRLINEANKTLGLADLDSIDKQEAEGTQLLDNRDDYGICISNVYLDNELKKLSCKGRKLMHKVYVDGYSLKECALLFGKDYHAVQKLQKRCLQKLKENLKEYN